MGKPEMGKPEMDKPEMDKPEMGQAEIDGPKMVQNVINLASCSFPSATSIR